MRGVGPYAESQDVGTESRLPGGKEEPMHPEIYVN